MVFGCDITDFLCVYTNELIGSPILTILLLGVAFFAYTSYKRIGLKTTMWLACVYFPIISFFISGNSFVFAIVTLLAAVLAAFLFTRVIGNR